MPVDTVPISPGRWRSVAQSISAASDATVDFPSVPVTPMTVSCSEGRPNQAVRGIGQGPTRSIDDELRRATSGSSRSTTTPTAPAATASATKAWPLTWTPGTAKNSVPGPTRRES